MQKHYFLMHVLGSKSRFERTGELINPTIIDKGWIDPEGVMVTVVIKAVYWISGEPCDKEEIAYEWQRLLIARGYEDPIPF